MARPKTPIKAWLMLSLAVLLLHLALLQMLPLRLNQTAAGTPAMRFATRTVMAEPVAPVAPKTKPTPTPTATPKAKSVAQAVPRPPIAAPVEPAPTEPTDDLAPLAAADTAVTALAPNAQPAPAIVPASSADAMPAASASASAPATAAATRAPHPPRDTPPSFSIKHLPASVKLVYKVEANKFPYSLGGELVWTHAGGHYLATLSFGAFGQTRTQTSRGQIGAQGLLPERFSDKYRSEVAAHFNQQQGKVTFSANTPDAPLLSGAQDRLSVLIQLAALVASAPEHFTTGSTLTLQTVGPRDADLWLFTVGNLEPLDLPGGTMQGLKLTRNPRQAYDQQVAIWLAPALGYLPARVRITETNGDFIDQKWVASEAASMP
jgi:hypothetical protein